MSRRVFNFSAGPAVLPEPALVEAQRDLLALPGVGSSILEISHRSAAFEKILEETRSTLCELLKVPDHYHVLFLQGGSRLQFSMVPMNVLGSGRSADYVLTGSWGKKAIEEARRQNDVRVAWDGGDSAYDRVPAAGQLDLDPRAAYVHFTSNETIQGVQFPAEPDTGDVPLVCDASSDFLSRPIPIERYGLLYACAQKNAGPAGVTVVILHEALIEGAPKDLPGMLSYRNHIDQGSLFNTPPAFGIYFVGLVARWLRDDVGGLEAMATRNRAKATWLYDAIDGSDGFYTGHAKPECRSVMNVTFRLPTAELEQAFLGEAKEKGLVALGGHRSVGGVRASIYNAMPEEGVETLRDFMEAFRKSHGG